MTFETKSALAVPSITVAQMREVDRAMIEDFHIELIQMMENAGGRLAELARKLFLPQRVTVLAGPGGNGGGGLVAARHLHNRGVHVSVVLSTEGLDVVAAHQLDIVMRMGVPILHWPFPGDLVIDALIGYGLVGEPRARTAELIAWANESPEPVLALDNPSGLDLNTGWVAQSCVRASATMTLALPKGGLASSIVVGRLFLADISVPNLLFEQMDISIPLLFDEGSIVELFPRSSAL